MFNKILNFFRRGNIVNKTTGQIGYQIPSSPLPPGWQPLPAPTQPVDDPRLKIFAVAKSCLGTDASPNDLVPDEFGCAETVSDILIKAGANMDVEVSTTSLYQLLNSSTRWIHVDVPLPGDVLISPTGFGGANGITHGHTGIVGENGVIMSNNSYTGKFEENYNLGTWKARYVDLGHYPMFYLRKIK